MVLSSSLVHGIKTLYHTYTSHIVLLAELIFWLPLLLMPSLGTYAAKTSKLYSVGTCPI